MFSIAKLIFRKIVLPKFSNSGEQITLCEYNATRADLFYETLILYGKRKEIF